MKQCDVERNNALLFFYFKIDGDKLNDTMYAKRVAQLDYVLKRIGVLVDE